MEKLQFTTEWDKTFPKSDKVEHSKVSFHNRYGTPWRRTCISPRGRMGSWLPSPYGGPFGAVKEQAAGLYAQTMAERGFLTMAFDPSFTGESGGQPRYMASPDINTEDFQAAVTIFPFGRMLTRRRSASLASAAGRAGPQYRCPGYPDKATVASTMYDMARVSQGLF